ncbi:Phospholipase DDHD2 [Fragariocoptes setiger]|uniref:Phospholipase DDHD2 n=1 Tax=Fragariocoptes setiger TaxID=1670756 RepID=A0ABQ7SB85_9ACAR|nr:Phospholipase DDHD2 [Fragariocoptes setiger]
MMSLDGTTPSSPETPTTPSSVDDASTYKPLEHHWFYRQLAGRKVRKNSNANVQQGATWQPFSGQDSIRLEKAFKHLQEQSKDRGDRQPPAEGEFVVATDGGRFDVDLVKRQRRPVYWRDDTYEVRRSSWYFKRDGYSRYEPYSESVSEQLEDFYRGCIEANDGWNKRFALSANEVVVMQGPNSIVHYDNCSTDEWLSMADNPTAPRQVHRGASGIFNVSVEDGFLDPSSEKIDHLIFFIHGIGGVCDIRFRSCVEVVNDFRTMANGLLTTAYNNKTAHQRRMSASQSTSDSSSRNRNSQESISRRRRIEFLPISWHSCTRRDTGINERLNLIALKSVPKLRQFLNKVIVDALLYSSGPVYCQTIVDNVGNEMNRLYALFLLRNPNFRGSVSIAGHSLGSIIAFDLLANQEPWQQTTGSRTMSEQLPDETLTNPISQTTSDPHNIDTSDESVTYPPLVTLFANLDIPAQYLEILQREHINDLYTLTLMSDADLKDVGFPLGIRRKLGTYINSHRMISMSIDARRQTANHNERQTRSSNRARRTSSESQATQLQAQKSSLTANGGANAMPTMDKQQQQEQEQSSAATMCNGPKPCMGQWMIRYPQLRFKPRCFFAFGSPMSMFLAVRGVHEIDASFRLPTCDRMLNIFHPYDPIAYRIEPLIDTSFSRVKPVLIPHHRGGKRIHLQLRDGIASIGKDIKHKILGSLKSTWTNLSELTRFGSQSSVASKLTTATGGSTTAATSATVSTDNPTTCQLATSSIAEESISEYLTSASSITTQYSTADNASSILSQSIESKSTRKIGKSYSDMELVKTSTRKGSFRTSASKEHNNLSRESSAPTTADNDEDVDMDEDNDDEEDDWSQMSTSVPEDEDCEQTVSPSRTVGALNGGRRLDYVLQEKPIEYMLNEYVFAFSSHASYWQNEDSAMMMLNEIYQVDNMQIFEYFD